MKTKHKVHMKAFCKLTATVWLDRHGNIEDIEDIEEVEEILSDEEIISKIT